MWMLLAFNAPNNWSVNPTFYGGRHYGKTDRCCNNPSKKAKVDILTTCLSQLRINLWLHKCCNEHGTGLPFLREWTRWQTSRHDDTDRLKLPQSEKGNKGTCIGVRLLKILHHRHPRSMKQALKVSVESARNCEWRRQVSQNRNETVSVVAFVDRIYKFLWSFK